MTMPQYNTENKQTTELSVIQQTIILKHEFRHTPCIAYVRNKAAFHLRVFHTHVHPRKSLNPYMNILCLEKLGEYIART